MSPADLKSKLERLKEHLIFTERRLRPQKVRFFEVDRLSGRRHLKVRVDPAPFGPWKTQLENKRFDLLAEIRLLEKQLPPRPRLASIIQDRGRAAHPSFGKRACRRRVRGRRRLLPQGRSVPADRKDLSGLWVKETTEGVLKPLLRVAEPGELFEKDQVKAKSVLRPLKVEPKRPRWKHRAKRKPFWKMFRNFKEGRK